MRPLGEAAQLERAVSMVAVAFLVLLVLAAIYVHSPWAALLALPAILWPFIFIADMYYWMRHFGLNLDPTAPLSSSIDPFVPVSYTHLDVYKRQELMHDNAQLALNGMRMVGQRFGQMQSRFQELATQRVEQRVARALLRLVRQFGRRVDEGVLIDIAISREELAQMTGTNLYNVSRILSKWEHAGWSMPCLLYTSRCV